MFLPCHAILESANKGRTSSSQPRASPDSCHPDTFSMEINKDPKDARFGTKGSSAFLLPRGKNRKGEDGTVQLSRWAMGDGRGRWAPGLPFRHPPYSTVSLSPSESARQREICWPRTLWASGFGFGSGDTPIASFSTEHLYPLAVSFSIDWAVLQLLSAAKSE